MSKDAMQKALEAMERYQVKRQDFDRFADEITALREALAEQPAQRTWVGLTDADWGEINDMPDTFDQGVAWAQARLKDKNT